MDFETMSVMLKVCELNPEPCKGEDLIINENWSIISVEDKQIKDRRRDYDDALRRHLVYHLTLDKQLPAESAVSAPLDYEAAVIYLEQLVNNGFETVDDVQGLYAKLHNDHIVSLELLVNTAIHQVRNEISALEALCPQGYVYTYDPASIFAAEIGASLLNRLMLMGLRKLSDHNTFSNMRIFSFNNYADRGIISLVSRALTNQPHVIVLRKDELFTGPHSQYNIDRFPTATGAMLVVHNNSDGFGQNIESEGAFGSLDGAIGSHSSAAASLARHRDDLLDFIY
jgi:hypothetical protein